MQKRSRCALRFNQRKRLPGRTGPCPISANLWSRWTCGARTRACHVGTLADARRGHLDVHRIQLRAPGFVRTRPTIVRRLQHQPRLHQDCLDIGRDTLPFRLIEPSGRCQNGSPVRPNRRLASITNPAMDSCWINRGPLAARSRRIQTRTRPADEWVDEGYFSLKQASYRRRVSAGAGFSQFRLASARMPTWHARVRAPQVHAMLKLALMGHALSSAGLRGTGESRYLSLRCGMVQK